MKKCDFCTKKYDCEGEYEFDCINKNYMYFVKWTEKKQISKKNNLAIAVKFTLRDSQDGYAYFVFDSYNDFGSWMANNYKKVVIWEIEVKEC